MSPESEALIARMLAMPKKFVVICRYDDGSEHRHETALIGQAENYAHHMSHRLGRDLIKRETGETVRMLTVEIADLA